MFDYQAGEKYKLTLIMVGLAGLMAGMFLAFLVMPNPEPPRVRPQPAYMNDPDVMGARARRSDDGGKQPAEQAPAEAQVPVADPVAALSLVQQWLPLAWDLSAGSAQSSQENAILYMTPDCASAYRQNIWTKDIAKQIDQSGIKSSFTPSRVAAGTNQSDGSILVFVEGEQVLSVPGKGSRARQVKLQYLIKSTADGLRVAGISEGGQKS